MLHGISNTTIHFVQGINNAFEGLAVPLHGNSITGISNAEGISNTAALVIALPHLR